MILATDNKDVSLEMNMSDLLIMTRFSILLFKKLFVLCVPVCQYVQHMPEIPKEARRGSWIT